MIYVENNSTNPFYNFALEYYLITEKQLPGDVIFLFWRTEPTLMVGKYQNTLEEINVEYAQENQMHVVRRITGGGTIYTDMGGWQFSFITKGTDKQIDFSRYTEPIITALNGIGVAAEFNSRNDLVIAGKKFSGNAQCMLNGHVLHHGSLLFDTNLDQMEKCLNVKEHKIVSKGIKSVRGRVTNISDHTPQHIDSKNFKKYMVESILGSSGGRYELTLDDIDKVNAIADEKFRTWQWNYGASPKFNITKVGQFDGGRVEFKLEVNRGIIEGCHIYGDFFGSDDIELLTKKLIGCKYTIESIRAALNEVKNAFYNIKTDELLEMFSGVVYN